MHRRLLGAVTALAVAALLLIAWEFGGLPAHGPASAPAVALPVRLEAAPEPVPAPVELDAPEAHLVELVNGERARLGRAPLIPVPCLMRLARTWATTMHAADVMRHRSPRPPGLGENVAFHAPARHPGDPRAEVDVLHRSWMDSAVHRENLLDERWRYVGVGVQVDGRVYGVQNFTARPVDPGADCSGDRGFGAEAIAAPPAAWSATPVTTAATPDDPERAVASDEFGRSVPLSGPEAHLIGLVNAARSGAGAADLRVDSCLMQLARDWAVRATANRPHVIASYPWPGGGTASGGYFVKETVATHEAGADGWRAEIDRAHATLMASAGDRADLLSAAHHDIGVGIALRDDTVTVVQNLTRDWADFPGCADSPPRTTPESTLPDPSASTTDPTLGPLLSP